MLINVIIDVYFVKSIVAEEMVGKSWKIKLENHKIRLFFNHFDDVTPTLGGQLFFWGFEMLFILYWLVMTISNIILLHPLWLTVTLVCLLLNCLSIYLLYRSGNQSQELEIETKNLKFVGEVILKWLIYMSKPQNLLTKRKNRHFTHFENLPPQIKLASNPQVTLSYPQPLQEDIGLDSLIFNLKGFKCKQIN